MGRVISTENVATERNRMMKAMSIALRELTQQKAFNAEARDLAAFLVLALDIVGESIERSVQPWEKRGYWLKADRFRMDWLWVEPLRNDLRKAIEQEDLGELAFGAATLSAKLKDVQVPAKHRLGTPWVGAWEQLHAQRK